MDTANRWIDPHWRELFQLHSTWVALFWMAFYGLFTLAQIFAFNGVLGSFMTTHPTLFGLSFMFATLTWGIARLTNQPGTQL